MVCSLEQHNLTLMIGVRSAVNTLISGVCLKMGTSTGTAQWYSHLGRLRGNRWSAVLHNPTDKTQLIHHTFYKPHHTCYTQHHTPHNSHHTTYTRHNRHRAKRVYLFSPPNSHLTLSSLVLWRCWIATRLACLLPCFKPVSSFCWMQATTSEIGSSSDGHTTYGH